MSTRIILPNGYSISCESEDAAGVPDITQNAGENVMKAEEEAQKPVTDENAEYDAAHEADAGKEIEDVQEVASQESFAGAMAIMNENTFYGLTQYRRAQEGFGIKDSFSGLKYNTEAEMWKDPKVLEAINTAKEWANKKGYSLATKEEVQANKQTFFTQHFRRAGKDNASQTSAMKIFNAGKIINVNGATLYTMRANTSMTDAVLFSLVGLIGTIPAVIRKLKGTELLISFIFFKKENGKVFAKGLAKATVNKAYATESAGIFSEFFARESAEAEGAAEPEKSDAPVTAEDTADETTDVSIEEETSASEEKPAEDKPETETKPEEAEGAAEPEKTADAPEATAAEDDKSEEEKAIESFFANWGN